MIRARVASATASIVPSAADSPMSTVNMPLFSRDFASLAPRSNLESIWKRPSSSTKDAGSSQAPGGSIDGDGDGGLALEGVFEDADRNRFWPLSLAERP